ncbi:MAG TPA: M56 family metallopeptidase [Thermoanaerobaculia bacterium]|nr:M56 family metallopeptidase [Thermoanaerobaculia bacterium]
MSTIVTSWATPWVVAVAWALIHFLWQGALVGLAVAGALRLLSKSTASLRYAVAGGALLVMLALPIGTALRGASSPGGGPVFTAPMVGQTSPSSPSGPGGRLREEGRGDEGWPAFSLPSALPWVFALWLAGVALLSIYHLGGWRQARRLTRTGRPLKGNLEATVHGLANRLGISRAVRLLESAAVPVPAVIGWLRPVILVPASTLAGLAPRQLEAVLAHELAHVRRHDYLVNLLQAAVETLLFYHPAVWWVSSQVRRERENCCDDLAVAVCGDRLGYARALVDLEGLRSPRLAMAADGGSLRDRVRRLAGVPEGRPRRSWMAGVLALSLLPAGLTFNVARGTAGPNEPAGGGREAAAASSQGREGTWSATRKGDRVQLEMSMSWSGGGHHHSWSNGEDYLLRDLPGLGTGPDVRFELRRDAGSFRFEGKFWGNAGSGTFTFAGNPGYPREMAALGYTVTEDRLLEMATHDVSLAFVREIHEAGYRDAALDKLVEIRIHGVSPQFIRELSALGYRDLPADQLVQFRIHSVSPELVRSLAESGYRKLPADQIVEFQIHGVSPEYVRGLAASGYRGVPADDLVQFRIHGISPQFVKELADAGYPSVAADDLVQFKIHGIDGGFVRQAVGRYGKLSADDLVQLKIRGRLDR